MRTIDTFEKQQGSFETRGLLYLRTCVTRQSVKGYRSNDTPLGLSPFRFKMLCKTDSIT